MIAEADWLTRIRHTPIALWAEGNVRIVEHPWRQQPFTVWVGEHVEKFTADESEAYRIARKHKAA